MGLEKKASKKLPKTTPEFEQAIKASANTLPISNKELVKQNKAKK